VWPSLRSPCTRCHKGSASRPLHPEDAAALGISGGDIVELVHRTSFHNLIVGIHPRSGKEYVHYE
jgi:hypothetical protein